MRKDRLISAFFCVIFTLNISGGCVGNLPEYQKCLSSFDSFYKIKKIASHFPDKSYSVKQFYCYSLSKEINFAEVYLTTNSNNQIINQLKTKKYQFANSYNSDMFFQVNIDLIRDSLNIFSTQIDNLNNSIPIGNFEQLNFGLGEYKDSIFSKKELKYQKLFKYIVPEDLKVYVIETKNGDFFTDEVHRFNRFNFLKKWKNGFSRGIAISEKHKIVTFWLVIW